MKEEILKILESDDIYDPFSYGSVNQFEASKRIDTLTHEHYMKFVEWFNETDIEEGDENEFYLIGDNTFENLITKPYTLEELYQFWLTNIEKGF
jgi:hypothetical protein